MTKPIVQDILNRKGKAKLVMLTCYDYSFAGLLDSSGVDIILVGDSLANVVLGLKETRNVSFSEMLNHTRAVVKGAPNSLVIADMPFVSYQKNPLKCLDYAKKFMAAGAGGVKIEWFPYVSGRGCPYVVKKLIKNGIPVMGHIGLTPQTAHLLGGFKVQGRTPDSARALLAQAKLLEGLGVFSLVLECIPVKLAGKITAGLTIPTISCGAGPYCDGQVLVLYDMLGLYDKIRPRFVRRYGRLDNTVKSAVKRFIRDVRGRHYPSLKESFTA
jgi:3-methyl-2-oxobutanoate hydroxymethyltransferase